MNAGVVACALVMAVCLVFGIAFFLLKGKAALLVSGFNSLPKNEQKRYDRKALARDMGNTCLLGTLIMAVGCALSHFLLPYAAIVSSDQRFSLVSCENRLNEQDTQTRIFPKP